MERPRQTAAALGDTGDVIWHAHIEIVLDARGEAEGSTDDAAFVEAFLAAANRIESVRDAWRARDRPPATPWDSVTHDVIVEFPFAGAEADATDDAWERIYHFAFDAAMAAAGDHRPAGSGGGLHVRAVTAA